MSAPARPFPGLGSWIERLARTAPDRPALIVGDRPVAYRALAARIRRLAGALAGLGVGPGDRVAWVGANHPAFLETLFATTSLGAALAPVNHRLPPETIAGILAHVEPGVIVGELDLLPERTPGAPDRIALGAPYEALLAAAPDGPADVPIGADDLALLPHTSGTTGPPKVIMLTHANVTWNVVNLVAAAGFQAGDVTVAIAPFFRTGGTGVNVLPVLFLGGTVVLPDDTSPDGILGAMERHRVSAGFGNPDLLEGLVRSERWATADLSALRFIITGGAPVPERLLRAAMARGITLQQGYGLSEASPFVLLLAAEHALERIGSAGQPPPLVETRIVGLDGRVVPTGVTGELQVRGPNVMAGYWRDPGATAAALSADGWLCTGDAARADADGFTWIVDRLGARFELDGRTVYPSEIEQALLADPEVADAGAGVVDGPDGRHIVAAVVMAPGGTPDGAAIRDRAALRLDPALVPSRVLLVEALPRSAVGKLVRGRLAALLTQGAGAGPSA